MSCLATPSFAAFENRDFQISLSEVSLSRALTSGHVDHLDLARTARAQFDITAIEYASRFFRDRAEDMDYLKEMNKRAADQDVRQLLIMLDGEGRLDDANRVRRKQAIHNHRKWVDAAKTLGCHSIAVETPSAGATEEPLARTAEAIRTVCDYAELRHINILVGRRNGTAEDASWLLRVIGQVDHSACGALASFAVLAASERKDDLAKLIPLAKGICATAYEFDDAGRETQVDFHRVASTIVENGYHGYVSIAYQGKKLGELEGIRATKALLETVRHSGA